MSQNYTIVNGELYHHGVKGQKWGRRRYQNPDGSLTPEGKRRAKYSEVKSDFYNFRNDVERNDKYARDLRKKANSLRKSYESGKSTEWADVNREVMSYTAKKAADRLVEKYGEKRYNKFVTENKIRNGAACVSMLTIVGFPVGAMLAINSVNGEGADQLKKR